MTKNNSATRQRERAVPEEEDGRMIGKRKDFQGQRAHGQNPRQRDLGRCQSCSKRQTKTPEARIIRPPNSPPKEWVELCHPKSRIKGRDTTTSSTKNSPFRHPFNTTKTQKRRWQKEKSTMRELTLEDAIKVMLS